MPKVFVAVTDHDWYAHLMTRSDVTDVNFWSPSPRPLAYMEPDTLVLFKLKAQYENRIVGGGFFVHFTVMPLSLAWDVFGEANGAPDLRVLRQRIARLRRTSSEGGLDLEIGCTVLASAFFLRPDNSLPPPAEFGASTVRVKGYDVASIEGNHLFESALAHRAAAGAPTIVDLDRDRYGTPVRPRRGQPAFRALVTDAYGRRCAVTGERTLPALEAAHVVPFSEGGEHSTRNGILLRSDLHRLFDRGYLTIDPGDLTLRVSRAIRDEFHNGRQYYELDHRQVSGPGPGFGPLAREYLERHRDSVFKAG